MLSATSEPQTSLDMFRLVLSLIVRREGAIPDSLMNHLSVVVAQAKALVSEPSRVPNGLLPESIDLAFEMKKTDLLRQQIEPLTSVDSIDATVARSLLTSMEERASY